MGSEIAILSISTLTLRRVFNPYASSNISSLSAGFRQHENVKHRAYGQRIWEVEHASFIPIILAAISGLAQETIIFYKRLVALQATK